MDPVSLSLKRQQLARQTVSTILGLDQPPSRFHRSSRGPNLAQKQSKTTRHRCVRRFNGWKVLRGLLNTNSSHDERCTACRSSSMQCAATHPLGEDDSDHDCFVVSGTVARVLRSAHCGNSFRSCAWIRFHSAPNDNSSRGRLCRLLWAEISWHQNFRCERVPRLTETSQLTDLMRGKSKRKAEEDNWNLRVCKSTSGEII